MESRERMGSTNGVLACACWRVRTPPRESEHTIENTSLAIVQHQYWHRTLPWTLVRQALASQRASPGRLKTREPQALHKIAIRVCVGCTTAKKRKDCARSNSENANARTACYLPARRICTHSAPTAQTVVSACVHLPRERCAAHTAARGRGARPRRARSGVRRRRAAATAAAAARTRGRRRPAPSSPAATLRGYGRSHSTTSKATVVSLYPTVTAYCSFSGLGHTSF